MTTLDQGGPEDPAAAAQTSAFAATVAALQGLGYLVENDEVSGQLRLLDPPVGNEPVVGQVLSHQDAVVWYAVRDDVVPPARRSEVAALTAALNPQLFVTTVEMDSATGVLAVRAAVCLQGVAVTRGVLGALHVAAASAAARSLATLEPAVAAVLAGTAPDLAASGFAHDLLADSGPDGVPAL